MSTWSKAVIAILLAATVAVVGCAGEALAQNDLKIMAPAAPGGGWDQTARAMQQALVAEGLAKAFRSTT